MTYFLDSPLLDLFQMTFKTGSVSESLYVNKIRRDGQYPKILAVFTGLA